MRATSHDELFSLAIRAYRAGDLVSAERTFRLLLSDPSSCLPAVNLGSILEEQSRYGEAIAIYRSAITRWPNEPRLLWRLGYLLLREGDYEEGWRLHEHREVSIGGHVGRPSLSFPEWKGQAVNSLVIFPEQGLGDQIMFARYIPLLVKRNIRVVTLCEPSLSRLFAQLGAHVLPAAGQIAIPRADAWALIGSLPYLFGTTVETIPPAPYLPAKQGGEGIGLMPAGSPIHRNDTHRSLSPEAAAEIASWPGVRSLRPEDTGAADMEDTARIVDDLDLVLTVDTSVAHLAGAMGKPCWLMLPARMPDWRWLRSRPDSPWYPSIKIFRQEMPGDWSTVVDQIANNIRARRLT